MKVLPAHTAHPYFVTPKCLYVLLAAVRKYTQDIIITKKEEERKGLRRGAGGLFRIVIRRER